MAEPVESRASDVSRIGIKEIARELGVSTGTVDRGLNGKPGVSAVTRARILAFAERVGYTPNLAGRLLSRRPYRVSVHVAGHAGPFAEALREGIRGAAASFAPALQLDFRVAPRPGEGSVSLVEWGMADAPDGLIVASDDQVALAPQLEESLRRNLPVVHVGSDAPTGPGALWVSIDPFVVGAVAGELLARFVSGPGEVAFFTGASGRQDHAATLRGFVTSLSRIDPAVTLASIVEADGDEREITRRTSALLKARPRLKGLCLGASHAVAVLRAAEREGRLAGLRVVVTDLVPDLVDWIRSGKVAATVDQRPRAQGQVALRSLYQLLQNQDRPPATQRLSPGVVIGSNLDFLLERRTAGDDHLDA